MCQEQLFDKPCRLDGPHDVHDDGDTRWPSDDNEGACIVLCHMIDWLGGDSESCAKTDSVKELSDALYELITHDETCE